MEEFYSILCFRFIFSHRILVDRTVITETLIFDIEWIRKSDPMRTRSTHCATRPLRLGLILFRKASTGSFLVDE